VCKFVRYLGGMIEDPVIHEDGYLAPGRNYEILSETEENGEVYYKLKGLKGAYRKRWFKTLDKAPLPVRFALADVMPRVGQELVCVLVDGKNLKPWYTRSVQKISEPAIGVYQVETCEGIYMVKVVESF